jgi:putative MATE family efflux protein
MRKSTQEELSPYPPLVSKPPSQGWFSLVREALSGSQQDFTEGPIGRAIVLLSVPMVMELVLEYLFALVSILLVLRLGADAVATVGITESLLSLIYAVAMGMSIGASAMVARRVGEKELERASRTAVQALVLCVLMAVPITVAGVTFTRPLLRLMGASAWVVEHGATFTQVMMGSTVSIMLLYVINAIFRGAGDAAIAMRVLWLANLVNLVLAPCLIFGLGPLPELGVLGGAVAIAIGRSVGVLYQLIELMRGASRVPLRRHHLVLEAQTMLTMLRLSAAAIVQMLVDSASWLLLVRIISGFGSAAVAGYAITMRGILLALLPSFGVSNAVSTLVGQSMGAGKVDRAEQVVRRAGLYNVLFSGFVGVCLALLTEPLVHVFTQEPEVAATATVGLRIVSCGFFFFSYGMVLLRAFNGAGDNLLPSVLSLFCFWGLELPLAYVLSHSMGLGPTGAFLAIAIAFAVLTLGCAVIFQRGRWKMQRA